MGSQVVVKGVFYYVNLPNTLKRQLANTLLLMHYLFNILLGLLLCYALALIVDPELVPDFIPDKKWNYQIEGWTVWGRDKLGHFLLMGAASLILNFLLRAKRVRFIGLDWLLGSMILAVLVTVEELRQVPLPDRSFEIFDLFYNFAGIFIFGRVGAWLSNKASTFQQGLSGERTN